jgi:DNA-directed RNA polymerase subunit RPC12/RpoP
LLLIGSATTIMSSVIDMRRWKAAHGGKPRALPRAAAEPCYFCILCGSEVFRILENGLVRCAGCSALVINVEARQL